MTSIYLALVGLQRIVRPLVLRYSTVLPGAIASSLGRADSGVHCQNFH